MQSHIGYFSTTVLCFITPQVEIKMITWMQADKPVCPVYMVTWMWVDKPVCSFFLQIIKELVWKSISTIGQLWNRNDQLGVYVLVAVTIATLRVGNHICRCTIQLLPKSIDIGCRLRVMVITYTAKTLGLLLVKPYF